MGGDDRAFDLLCALSRPEPEPDRIREILKNGIDAGSLAHLAAHHGVRPALARLLTPALDIPSSIARSVREALTTFERDHVVRSLAIADELVRVLSLFAATSIPVVVFKGPVLAVQLYGGLAQREYADIDLLVPPDCAEAAKALLASLGYRNAQGDPAFVRTFLGAQRQVSLERPGSPCAIDLHWAFTGRGLPFPLTPDELWSRLDTVIVGGYPVPTLAPEDLALMLAGHGTKEAWRRLVWVADFAWLMERHPELDWARLLARARRQHCGGALLLAVTMAHRVLGTAVPAALGGTLSHSPGVDAKAATLIAALRRGPAGGAPVEPTEGPGEHLYDLLLCDRAIDRLWVVARTILTPTAGDYHALPLPRPLWPLYWVTRPFRLAAKALRAT